MLMNLHKIMLNVKIETCDIEKTITFFKLK